MKKVYKGIVEGNVIRLEKPVELPLRNAYFREFHNTLQRETRRDNPKTITVP